MSSDVTIPKVDRIIVNFAILKKNLNLFTHQDLVDLVTSNRYVLDTLSREESEKLVAGVSVEMALALAEISNRWKKLVSEYNDSIRRESEAPPKEVPVLVAEEVSKLVLANKLTKDDIFNLASVNKKFNAAVKHIFYKEWNSTQRDDIRNVLFGEVKIYKDEIIEKTSGKTIKKMRITAGDQKRKDIKYLIKKQWLFSLKNIPKIETKLDRDQLLNIINTGNLSMIKWLDEIQPKLFRRSVTNKKADIRYQDIIENLCDGVHSEALKWYLENYGTDKIVKKMVHNFGKLNIHFMEWAMKTYNIDDNDIKIHNNAFLTNVVNGGNINFIKWTLQTFKFDKGDLLFIIRYQEEEEDEQEEDEGILVANISDEEDGHVSPLLSSIDNIDIFVYLINYFKFTNNELKPYLKIMIKIANFDFLIKLKELFSTEKLVLNVDSLLDLIGDLSIDDLDKLIRVFDISRNFMIQRNYYIFYGVTNADMMKYLINKYGIPPKNIIKDFIKDICYEQTSSKKELVLYLSSLIDVDAKLQKKIDSYIKLPKEKPSRKKV